MRTTIPGLRISPCVLSNPEYVRVLQVAWPVIAERFPSLSEEQDLFVEVAGAVYVIQFLRLPADWAFDILRLNDETAARVRQRLGWGFLQLPCWIEWTEQIPAQAGLG